MRLDSKTPLLVLVIEYEYDMVIGYAYDMGFIVIGYTYDMAVLCCMERAKRHSSYW